MTPRILAALILAAIVAASSLAHAQTPSFAIEETYSNADGAVHYVVLPETQGLNAQTAFAGLTLTATRAGATKLYTFPRNLPSAATAGARVLVGNVGGPSWFARTTDGGASWEPARPILDLGTNSQTLNNISIVLPDGTLINFFTRIDYRSGGSTSTLQLIRSPDKGANWSAPITIAALQSVGVTDPELGTNVRDARLLGSIAVGRDGQLAVVWQDARFNGSVRDAVALSRSFDGDLTWRESRVAGPFDYGIAPNANGLFIGDYMGLATRGTEFLSIFAVANNGNAGNHSDITFAAITSPGTPAPGAVAAKAGADDDPNDYRTEARRPEEVTPALAARFDAPMRDAMQHRVPGWISPAQPAGATRQPARLDLPH